VGAWGIVGNGTCISAGVKEGWVSSRFHAKIIRLVLRDGMVYAYLVFRISSKTGVKLARSCRAHKDRVVGSFYTVLTVKQLILQDLYMIRT
jgi:hypothetical protein